MCVASGSSYELPKVQPQAPGSSPPYYSLEDETVTGRKAS